MFRSLLADLAVGALHFFLMRVRHGLPGSQQRLESFLYSSPRIRHTCLECSAHTGLEPPKKFLLLAGHAVRELFSRGIHVGPRFFLGPLQLLAEAIQLLTPRTLNFIGECRSRSVRGLCKQRPRAFE